MPVDMHNLIDSRGEPHGIVNSIPNSVPDKDFSQFKPKDREAMKKLKDDQCKLVDVRYINSRGAHEILETTYAMWAGENLDKYRLLHDHVYTVPQGFVDMINKNPGLKKRSELLDVNGRPTEKDGPSEKIHNLYPASF